MRLVKIQLAGFKSFVEPTTIDLPSDLVGIVGPNGCGKSNVIDAVRWVMGESSARHLRGDSMADVIFNGSTARKPVGQASVELVFDNADGRLGERYAAYAEIAVRRQVTRDGTSSYFLNGTRCRRRDITDLFLGTGLGPRSYAVIEQGMISRLIEARPEELRDYLEEVAGISRYKERRRETENRMRHTREHLERLTDIREELDRQLQRLDRQAKQAERYKVLKGEERVLEAQVLGLRWQRLAVESEGRQQAVQQQVTAVEAVTAELRRLESQIEQSRVHSGAAGDAANATYRTVLEASAEVARTEESITSMRRARTQLADVLERETQALTEARARIAADERQLAELSEQLGAGEPALASLEAAMGDARERFAASEQQMHEWQTRAEELAREAQAPGQTAHTERARIENLEERLQQLHDAEARLRDELDGIDLAAAGEEAQAAASELRLALAQRDETASAVEHASVTMRAARDEAERLSSSLHETRARLQQLQGTHASLEALQKEALGKSDTPVVDWLTAQGLSDRERVAERIEVDGGWERAVEVVLAASLEAVTVTEVDAHAAALGRFAAAPLALVEEELVAGAPVAVPDDALARNVRAPDGVLALLWGVRAAPDLDGALAARAQLAGAETFVTPDGFRVGRSWLRAPGPPQASDGVLARAQRLRDLERELAASTAAVRDGERDLATARAQLEEEEKSLAVCQAEANAAHRRHAGAEAEVNLRTQALERARERIARLESERREVLTRREVDMEELGAARRRLGEATAVLERVETQRAEWSGTRDETRQGLEAARNEWNRVREEGYRLGLQVEGWRTRLGSLEESRLRTRQELARLERHRAEVQAEFEQTLAPIETAEAALQEKVIAHRDAETKLRDARVAADAVEAQLRELDAARTRTMAQLETARGQLEQARLHAREAAVRLETVREQLGEHGDDVDAVIADLPEDATEAAWSDRLEEMARRISRLGAINLAAIDEYQEHNERKTYLDAQHADLDEALATLEAAIVRIDKETRSRFKDTFEKVNRGLSERFPRLFGGGQAYLQLSGEDLLNAGVSVMAQPPGKRNSTIALLSGGEKALTAVALVFAMFDLNPAPFCLLDEVDAPLDDANVGRFSQLVRDMSERVQMLVVTHNKTTMETVQHLIGVTMHEPGVSRLVAVDIDAAVAMVGT